MALSAKTRATKAKKHSEVKEVWRRFRKNKAAMIGLGLALRNIPIGPLRDEPPTQCCRTSYT